MHTNDATLGPSSLFDGRYEILTGLGEGGFGTVHKARQLSTGQLVALKVLRVPDHGCVSRPDRRVDRFLRETRLCAQLHHPNIVQLADSGQTADGTLYIAFSFAPGDNLAALLAREGALAPREACHLMLQALDALACAHTASVVHRDLKPSNIMVVPTGARRNALVLDFGIGVMIDDERSTRLTGSHEGLGTPGYGAPEQWRGAEPSPRADLFSWGLVFLECLIGSPVYSGPPAELFYRLLSPDPVPLPPALARHPLGTLIASVVRKDAAARDVTARGLFEALDACDLRGLSRDAMRTGSALPMRHIVETSKTINMSAPVTTGDHRQVTAFSCVLDDAASSSAGSRANDVEDARLRASLAFASEIARHHGGHVAAMLGDEVLVYFGYPHAAEDDARRAARAALGILGAIEVREPRVQARLGVHTGFVVAHDLGDPALAAGHTSRLVSRLARNAAPGAVLLTAETHKLLRGWFAFEASTPWVMDEAGARLEVFRLGRADPALGSTPDTAQGRFVGRAQEIELLMDRWRRARGGSGQASLVIGEPGIGKSRLVRQLRAQLEDEVHTLLEGRCAPDTKNHALFPIVELLGRALALDTEPSATGKVALIEVELARLGLPAAETMPLLLPLLSLPAGGAWPPLDVSPQKHRELTLNAILAFLFARAEQRPVLLVVEDLHWADPTTLELLGQLVREAPSSQVCVLLTARPEFSPSFSTVGVLQVHLNRLEPAEIAAMVDALMGGKALPPAALAQVVSRTDGVPLFIEQLTRMLVEAGTLVEQDGRYELVGSLSDVEIPSTLRGLLTARLDRLGRAKETAQLAAVLGREFSVDVLTAVSALGAAGVQEDLDRLMEAGLVLRRRRVKDLGAMFKHALVRDAAYESIALGARQTLHARTAATLEERFQDLAAARPELLAHHWTSAGHVERAIPYWLRAGQRALSQSANREALRHLEQALELVATLPATPTRVGQELELRLALSIALIATQGYAAEAVGATYERARMLCDELGDSKQVFPVLWGLGAFYAVRGELDTALELATRVLGIAEAEGEAGLLVLAHLELGGTHLWRGELRAAKHSLERGLTSYRPAEHSALATAYSYDPGAAAQAYLAMTDWFLGFPDRALASARAALAQTRAMGHAHSYVHSLTRTVQVTLLRGESRAVLDDISAILAISAEKGFSMWHAFGVMLRGRALCLMGQVDSGLDDLRSGLQRTLETGSEVGLPEWLYMLAEALAALGRYDEALDAIGQALEQTVRPRGQLYKAELCRIRGELYLRADATATGGTRAEESLRMALEVARQQDARSWQLRAACSLARLWHGQRNTAAAYDLLNESYTWFTEGLHTPALESARELLDELRR